MSRSIKKIISPASEHSEQVRIFQWANLMQIKHPELKYMFSTLNGVRLSIGSAKKAKNSGNKKGVPDIFLPLPKNNYSGLFIELKIKGGVVKPEQKDYIKFLKSVGYCAEVIYGSDDAISLIQSYINGEVA